MARQKFTLARALLLVEPDKPFILAFQGIDKTYRFIPEGVEEKFKKLEVVGLSTFQNDLVLTVSFF